MWNDFLLILMSFDRCILFWDMSHFLFHCTLLQSSFSAESNSEVLCVYTYAGGQQHPHHLTKEPSDTLLVMLFHSCFFLPMSLVPSLQAYVSVFRYFLTLNDLFSCSSTSFPSYINATIFVVVWATLQIPMSQTVILHLLITSSIAFTVFQNQKFVTSTCDKLLISNCLKLQ